MLIKLALSIYYAKFLKIYAESVSPCGGKDTVYWKSETWDPGCLQIGPRDPGSGTLGFLDGTRDLDL